MAYGKPIPGERERRSQPDHVDPIFPDDEQPNAPDGESPTQPDRDAPISDCGAYGNRADRAHRKLPVYEQPISPVRAPLTRSDHGGPNASDRDAKTGPDRVDANAQRCVAARARSRARLSTNAANELSKDRERESPIAEVHDKPSGGCRG